MVHIPVIKLWNSLRDYTAEFLKKRRLFTAKDFVHMAQEFDKLQADRVELKTSMGTNLVVENKRKE